MGEVEESSTSLKNFNNAKENSKIFVPSTKPTERDPRENSKSFPLLCLSRQKKSKKKRTERKKEEESVCSFVCCPLPPPPSPSPSPTPYHRNQTLF
jgi:hypothetical protein